MTATDTTAEKQNQKHGDEVFRLSRSLKDAERRAEKHRVEAERAGRKAVELSRQLAEAKEAARHAHRAAGQICGAAVPELNGGLQLRFDRDYQHGAVRIPKGTTVGVFLPSRELPLDFVASGIGNGLIRASVIVPQRDGGGDEKPPAGKGGSDDKKPPSEKGGSDDKQPPAGKGGSVDKKPPSEKGGSDDKQPPAGKGGDDDKSASPEKGA